MCFISKTPFDGKKYIGMTISRKNKYVHIASPDNPRDPLEKQEGFVTFRKERNDFFDRICVMLTVKKRDIFRLFPNISRISKNIVFIINTCVFFRITSERKFSSEARIKDEENAKRRTRNREYLSRRR